MPSLAPKFTFRTSQSILDKLRYIADDHFRTVDKELEMLVKQHIADYESEHGEIKIPSDNDDQ